MSAATISFFASAGVAGLAALAAVASPRPRHALAGFAVVLVALVGPLIQLRAPMIAGVSLFSGAVVIGLLGALAGQNAPRPPTRRTPVFWGLAGLGLLGFVWVLLATGSRQVVEPPPALTEAAAFGQGASVMQVLAGEHLVASVIVGLLALACVIAAVLSLVGEER